MKKEIKINFRVEVYPRTTLAEEEDVCISIVADINRHVNDVRFTEIVAAPGQKTTTNTTGGAVRRTRKPILPSRRTGHDQPRKAR